MIFRPLSIVVPVRNRPELILRCLDSIINQSYRPIRLIVVDNESTDNTPDVVAKWKAANESEDFTVTIVSESRHGAAAARNRGLLEVDSDYMLFFDSDDVMRPELAVTVMETFDRNPKLDLIYWRRAFINSKEEVIPARYAHSDLLGNHLYHAVLSTQSYAIRTSLIKRVGGWDSSLMCWNDLELGLRILSAEPNANGIFRVLVHIYPQKESITGTDFHSKAGEWEKALDKMDRVASEFPKWASRRIKDIITYRRIILAAHYKREGYPELAKELYQTALKQTDLPSWRLRLLQFIYRYTATGGRGASILWR